MFTLGFIIGGALGAWYGSSHPEQIQDLVLTVKSWFNGA